LNSLEDLKLQKNDSFEMAIKKLEKIVALLDDGKLALDETLGLYEEGIRLYRYCNQRLNKTEQQISLMLNEEEVPFDFANPIDTEGEE
jgi:exodeoxyribonuclease VII small subunit